MTSDKAGYISPIYTVSINFSPYGKNINWGCLTSKCRGKCLDLVREEAKRTKETHL